MIRAGKIIDGKTIIGFLMWRRYGRLLLVSKGPQTDTSPRSPRRLPRRA
jgi:hypothetical protein